MVAACREDDPAHGKAAMQAVIDALAAGVPIELTELRRLGRTLRKRAADVLAYFDRPDTSHGPAEAINGRLEHLRGIALGFCTWPTTSPEHSWRPAASDPPTHWIVKSRIDRAKPERLGSAWSTFQAVLTGFAYARIGGRELTKSCSMRPRAGATAPSQLRTRLAAAAISRSLMSVA